MRVSGKSGAISAGVLGSLLLGAALSARVAAELPANFDQRFATACGQRGLTAPRCACVLDLVKELIADQHLELMLLYFEDEQQLDERMMQELENDEARFNALKQEIEEAVEAARVRCAGR